MVEKRLVRFVFVLVVLISFLSMVSAVKTPVVVKTLQYHDVEIAVADGGSQSFSLIERLREQADEYGDVTFEIDTVKKTVNLYVYIKRNGETVAEDKYFGEAVNGQEIYIELVPSGYELIPTPEEEVVINDEENNETIIEEIIESPESGAGITGAAIMDTVLSKKVLYSVGGVIGVLIILWIILKIIKHKKNSGTGEIKVRKLSEVNSDPKEKIENKMQMIEDAERKIREAQQEIGKLRNEEKIKEIKKKMEEDQKELMKLGG